MGYQERNKHNGFSCLRKRGFPKFSSPCLQFYNLLERFSKIFSPCLQFYNLLEGFQSFPLHVYNSTIYLRGFQSFPLHVYNSTIYLRGFPSFPLHVFTSTIYLRGFSHFLPTFYILKSTRGFCKFFLSTTLHPSTYQEIYISSPQFYIPPRNIGVLSTILHSTTYN